MFLTILLFQYMNALTKSEKLRAFIAPKMTYPITFLDKNGKSAVFTGGYIHGIYRYLVMIGAPTTLTNSDQRSHHFDPSSSSNNDAATLQPVIADLCMTQKIICECCRRIGHKAEACIIHDKRLLQPSLRINKNHFNAIHGD